MSSALAEVSVAWEAQEGSQTQFMGELVFECLYEGTRGPGKTDALLMCYAQYVGRGFGADWRGIIFRETFSDLSDMVAKSKKWFYRMFPGVKFNETAMTWTWPGGEQLLLRYMRTHSDYDHYHGHAYPFIGWEELTAWADDVCYCKMFSCCRSTNPDVPRMVRSTCNPAGKGHNWVKRRFALPQMRYIERTDCRDEEGNLEPPRLAIHGRLSENKILLENDPGYRQRLSASASSPAERKAWMQGDWDVVAGGMFDDIWFDAKKYIIKEPFDIPKSWKIDRSFDWGSSKPFSVGWWAQSDGSDVQLKDGTWMSTVPEDLFRIAEWYGCGAKPNTGLKMESATISLGIIEREKKMQIYGRVKPGVADSSIFDVEDGNCIADNMAKKVRIGQKLLNGVTWLYADKRPGSRVPGWIEMRTRLSNTVPPKGSIRENPGLFFFTNCRDTIAQIPVLPRDKEKPDDLDTKVEDHIADEIRYRVRHKTKVTTQGTTRGH